VIGINFYSEFLDQAYHDQMKARHRDLLAGLNHPPALAPEELDRFAAERLRTFFNDKLFDPPFERIIEHIDHAVKVVGADHVGLGADLDSGPIPLPAGFDDVSDYPKIARALLERGLREREVKNIMGGNFLRVFEDVVGA
jgi:membrane dipeptidase